MKYHLTVFFSLFSFFFFAQQEVVSFKNNEVSKRTKKNSYTISDVINNKLAIVLIERKEVYAYLFDTNFKEKSYFKTQNVKSKYNKALGYSSNNGYSTTKSTYFIP